MYRLKKVAHKASIGLAVAAMTMSMGISALAADTASVDTYGSNATVYGNAATDEVGTFEYEAATETTAAKVVSVPSAADRCTIKVYGVDAGATVKAYHLIEGNYNKYGFTGWTQTVASAGISKFESFHNVVDNVKQVVAKVTDKTSDDYNKGLVITEENISLIAQAIASGTLTEKDTNAASRAAGSKEIETITLTQDPQTGVYSSDAAEAGTYLILVRSENKGVIYNPMVVSNDYSHANNAQSLSNVTATKANAVKNGNKYVQMHADYTDYVEERGVDTDANNSFKDYKFVIGSDLVSKKAVGLDHNEEITQSEPGENNNKNTYPDARKNLTYYRDVEANGNVYALYESGDIIAEAGPGQGQYAKEDQVTTMALLGRAYAKKSSIGLEKNIRNASVLKGTAQDDQKLNYSKYDDSYEGKTVEYDILTSVPDYSDIYFATIDDFTFKVTDKQSKGLDPVTLVEVYAGFSTKLDAAEIADEICTDANKVAAANYTFKAGTKANNQFSVDFKQAWATDKANANKKIVIRYATKINKDSKIGLDGNENEAFLDFTTTPDVTNGSGQGHKFDFCLQYTFKPTIAKVGEDGSVEWAESVAQVEGTDSDSDTVEKATEVTNPLAGAKFKLIRIGDRTGIQNGKYTANLVESATEKALHNIAEAESEEAIDKTHAQTWYMTSDENGYIQFDSEFDGIDEGLYAIYEYEAPKNYSLNDRIYYIEISPDYDVTLQRFPGTDVEYADAAAAATNDTYKMKLVNSSSSTYSKTAAHDGRLDKVERLINKYTITEYNSGTEGTTDAAINPQDAATFKATTDYYWDTEDDKSDKTTKEVSSEGIIAIPNTKLAKLPSTGGIGTLVFTGAGIVLMGGAVFAMRKKKEDE